MRHAFSSISRQDTVYVFDSQNRDYSRGNFVCDEAREYPTYGDGTVQHGPLCRVSADHTVDFLVSYARFLLAHGEAVKELSDSSLSWPTAPYRGAILFALSVKFDEHKQRFYSMTEQKVSSSPSKANDRRYEAVPSWADGSLNSAFTLLCQSYYHTLDRIVLYFAIVETINGLGGSGSVYYGPGDVKLFGLTDNILDVQYAFESVNQLVQAERTKKQAERFYSSVINNWANNVKGLNIQAA